MQKRWGIGFEAVGKVSRLDGNAYKDRELTCDISEYIIFHQYLWMPPEFFDVYAQVSIRK